MFAFKPPAFWSRDGGLPRLLSPLGAGYDALGRLHRSLAKPHRLTRPVICVGNLTLGGAGKTPVVLALLELSARRGKAAHVVSRGYGGREAGPLRVDPSRHDAATVGDEALLLARAAPTWIARDRAAGARAAVAAGAELVILDDGFQNPSLMKDLSLLVVDGEFGFGNGRVFPAGPLRETIDRGLARADAVILLGDDRTSLTERLERAGTVLHAVLEPELAAGKLAGRRVFAFAGIGRPEKFFASLERLGAEVVGHRAFADHHPYSGSEIRDLLKQAAALDAVAATTEKDAVRLPPDARGRVTTVAVSVRWQDCQAVEDLLAR